MGWPPRPPPASPRWVSRPPGLCAQGSTVLPASWERWRGPEATADPGDGWDEAASGHTPGRRFPRSPPLLRASGPRRRAQASRGNRRQRCLLWNKEGCADNQDRFGATVAIGLTIFVLFIVTIIACFTCSCCCLYKMCRRPRPIVTTTTATTVVHAPYPQPAGVPPSYPGPSYQGYHPMPPQPGMVAAPYPTQYPPPYPAQPVGPPAYHETLAGDAAMAYPASQPPYNPAYMDPPKATR